MKLRDAGLSPRSINGYLTGLNSFLRWCHTEGHAKELVVVPKLKCEEKLIETFSIQQVERLLSFKPKGLNERRSYTLVCLLLDTGLRISEALGLAKEWTTCC